MAEPSTKRLKTNLPVCKTHRACVGSKVKQNLTSAVEESLCGVSTLLLEVAYRLEALSQIFEQDDVALPRVAAFFHQESGKEQEQAEAMMDYLCERGGQYCNKDIQKQGSEQVCPCVFQKQGSEQKPGCEQVCAVLPALELLLAQWKDEMCVLVDLSLLARQNSDPHSASVVKSRFLGPLVARVKLLGDLLTNARRLGCGAVGTLGEYLIDQLQEELTSAGVA
ncbi:ferritin light chain, oocyte isoform-like isoform X1 [Hypomesus transpacificus]|uniref:ferritin light chain, oocyte isoform-like isoform X1 n=1 Tax=Hypomesus transpacificus TaxID=137520 RepID=UPI001F0743E1|nr:ferritin light chain, oocyte isoform-like isoform X1 [Hypomesus transpacificus]